jgi:triosephosphate isomerase
MSQPDAEGGGRAIVVGVGLKMYFDPGETLAWSTAVAELARRHEAIVSGRVSLFVLPSFPMLSAVIGVFAGTRVAVGAQDLFWEDRGAFTGEVSGADLRQLGCTLVEVGHAERRLLFGEDDEVVARKLAAALRNGLRPVLCVGEKARGGVQDAAASCIHQLESALAHVDPDAPAAPITVAYEPGWAIGAEQSASLDHVGAVASRLRGWLGAHPKLAGSPVIYGGSAGPGLLTTFGDAVDGLFLGRFAHDPAALEAVLDEATDIT